MLKLFCCVCLFSYLALFAQDQVLHQLAYEIRDPHTDSLHFRKNLERIGEYLALNVLNELQTKEVSIRTVLGVEAKHSLIEEMPVLVTILRAGLPLNAGVQKVFPQAEVGFLAMSRNEETLKAKVEYVALPDIRGRTLILVDTMLATGGSLLDAIQILDQYAPKKIFIISAIASAPGIDRIHKQYPNIKILAAAIDADLNEKGYIVPGLGDAGDRLYGKKKITKIPN